MLIHFVLHGKTDDSYLKEGILKYTKRIKHYISFNELIIPALKSTKNLNYEEIKQKEGELLLSKLKPSDTLVLLDEKGVQFSSLEMAEYMQKWMNQSLKNIFFVVGGAYGFSDEVYQRANFKLSLSKMTFSHQMIRLLFAEQLYRAFTILNNEPYHHE
jgi:23S rRNA (pseudouridine1915-N3)-methyltransferase